MGTPKKAARTARRSDTFRIVARVGFVVIGLVHIIIGAIAVSIASGGGGDADQDGAMQQIRSTPVGGLILGAIAVALIALAVWQILAAFMATGKDDARKWGQRIKLLGIAAAYLVIAGLALVFAFGGHAESEETSQAFSAIVLSAPGGVVALIIVGLGVAAVGAGFFIGGFTRGFEKTMDLPSGPSRVPFVALGVAGYLAKGIAVGVTGVLFVVAAWTHDPDKAAGLDAALRSLADLPFGRLILWLVGAGLVIYGLFSIVRARYARM